MVSSRRIPIDSIGNRYNTTALSRIVERQWTAAFKPFDLTPSQAFMLRLILKNTQLSQQEISVHLGIAKATTTRILLGLENKKLIKRTPANSDTRISLVSATRKAQTITQELDNCSQAVTLKIKKLISNTMFEKTVSQLKLIRDALN